MAIQYSFGERVLGLAFDVARERFYVLEVDSDGALALVIASGT